MRTLDVGTHDPHSPQKFLITSFPEIPFAVYFLGEGPVSFISLGGMTRFIEALNAQASELASEGKSGIRVE